MNVIITAGSASRLGKLAPHGCKALVKFRGKPIVEWQLERLGKATIVCQTQHVQYLKQYGHLVIDDSLEGPAHALYRALDLVDEPVTVAYADTFWEEDLPDLDAWCGVAPEPGQPGHFWDVVHNDVVYTTQLVKEGEQATVCVGLYRFFDPHLLRVRLFRFAHCGAGLAHIVNTLNPPFVPIESWQDLGTPEALEVAA